MALIAAHAAWQMNHWEEMGTYVDAVDSPVRQSCITNRPVACCKVPPGTALRNGFALQCSVAIAAATVAPMPPLHTGAQPNGVKSQPAGLASCPMQCTQLHALPSAHQKRMQQYDVQTILHVQ